MATNPANTPLMVILGSALPNFFIVKKRAAEPPLAPASIVLIAIGASSLLEASKVLPALKANQPNQRIKAPADANGILLGANTFTLPSELNRPLLGPSHFAIASA